MIIIRYSCIHVHNVGTYFTYRLLLMECYCDDLWVMNSVLLLIQFALLFISLGTTAIMCDKRAACPGESVTCTCITGRSNTLVWSSDELIGPDHLEFGFTDRVGTRLNVTGLSTSAALTGVSNPNGVVVISSDLTFVASENPANILTCSNTGRQSSESMIIPMSSK